MSGTRPYRGRKAPYDLAAVAPEARPTERITEITSIIPGSHPRHRKSLGVDKRGNTWFWCRCCNRCLGHERAFCDEHEADYNKHRTSHYQAKNATVHKVPTAKLEAIGQGTENLFRALRADRSAAKELNATERMIPGALGQRGKITKHNQRLNERIDAAEALARSAFDLHQLLRNLLKDLQQ